MPSGDYDYKCVTCLKSFPRKSIGWKYIRKPNSPQQYFCSRDCWHEYKKLVRLNKKANV